MHKCKLEHDSYSFLPKLKKNASLIDRFKRSLRKSVLVANHASVVSKYFRSQASVNYERKRQVADAKWYIIHPFSSFRMYWETIMLFVYAVSFVIIPLEVTNHFATKLNKDTFINWGVILILAHSIYICDIAFTCLTGYCDDLNKVIIFDPKLIFMNYLKTYLCFDLLSTVPAVVYIIFIYFVGWRNSGYYKWTCLSLMKVFRFSTFVNYGRRFTDKAGLNDLIFRVVRFVARSIYCFHWGGQLLFILPFLFSEITATSKNAWFHYMDQNVENIPFEELYLRCLFQVVSITLGSSMIDRAPTIQDFIIALTFHCAGLLYSGYLFVEILDIMRSKFEAGTKYDEFMTQLQEYMRHKQLPLVVQERLFSFYEYRYRHAYFKEGAIKSTLCERLSKEISSYGCEKMIKNVKLFEDLSNEDIKDLVQNLTLQVYLPKDLIIKAGSIGNTMYFLSCGTVAVYTPSGREVCHLYDGAYFGEIALIMKDRKRTASVSAVEICELYVMDRNIFNRRLRSNVKIYENLFKLCQQRLKETKAVEVIYNKPIEEGDLDDAFRNELLEME